MAAPESVPEWAEPVAGLSPAAAGEVAGRVARHKGRDGGQIGPRAVRVVCLLFDDLPVVLHFDRDGRVERLEFDLSASAAQSGHYPRVSSPAVARAVEAVEAWRGAPDALAELPSTPAATPFQARLRAALWAVPAGEWVTYGQLARQLRTAPRAVAAGCRANPIPLIVPCHRVVATTGCGGYLGAACGRPAAIKERLLALERQRFTQVS